MELGNITLSELAQTQEEMSHVPFYLWILQLTESFGFCGPL